MMWNKSRLTMKVGQVVKLKLKNSNTKVSWSSSKKNVAKVNKKGKVTAVKKGTAKITAKAAKKKYICKVKVINSKIAVTPQPVVPIAVPTAVSEITISNVNVLEEYHVEVKLSAAQTLTKDDFIVMSKTYSNGSYNKKLKIGDISTKDNLTYQIILDDNNPIGKNNCVQVTVKNLAGTGAFSCETIYVGEKCNYLLGKHFYMLTQGVKCTEKKYSMYGVGYSKVISVTGIPEGVTYTVYDNELQFIGIPKTAGTYQGEIITEDELGNRYISEVAWLVGSDDCLAATLDSDYYVIGDYTYGGFMSIVATGGSGEYEYEVIEGSEYCIVHEESLSIKDMGEGTYRIKVKVNDKYDTSRTTIATGSITIVKGKKVTGSIRDGLGNPMTNQVFIEFINKEDMKHYITYDTGTGFGEYGEWLEKGTYKYYAYIDDTKSALGEITVNDDMSNVDIVLPVYPVKVECDKDFGEKWDYSIWTSDTGARYQLKNNILYLPIGTYNLSAGYTDGSVEYTGTISLTVTAQANNTANMIVTEYDSRKEYVIGDIKVGEEADAILPGTRDVYYKFVPEETEIYRINLQIEKDVYGGIIGCLTDEKGYTIDTFNNSECCEYYFEAGETYYIGVSKRYNTSSDAIVKLLVEEAYPEE